MRFLNNLRITLMIAVVAFTFSACSRDNHGFDPAANPFTLVEQAKSRAQSEHKKILVMAGGAWCHWCRALDNFIHADSDLNAGFSSSFVTVKIYSGEENDNKAFFSTLPAAPGVPHFWVMDEQGRLLKSQATGEFETGRDRYDKNKLLTFISEWRQK